MTEQEVEGRLVEMLTGGGKDTLPEMRSDFRKLRVSYICTANGNESLCQRFVVGVVGICTFKEFEYCRFSNGDY
jgi:hypothetical protein